MLLLAAVPYQLHQVGVPELPQEDHLCLHARTTKPHARAGSHQCQGTASIIFIATVLGTSPDSIRPPAGCRNCHIAQQT
jgi:hypothetical protein